MFNLLVVEDHPHIRTIIEKNLSNAGYHVFTADNGEAALELFYQKKMDAVITDIMMPVMDGNSLVKAIRNEDTEIPILMLTALETYKDKEKSFETGSDDYMVKPVDMKELLLRIKALLRRAQKTADTHISLPDIKLDYRAKTCVINGQSVPLKLKEFELLYFLTSNSPNVFSRDQLLDEIWGYESESFERTIDTHIKSLRQKVTSHHLQIKTVRGLGYKVEIYA